MDLGKELRHRALRDLVARRAIRTQRELVAALRSQGIPATQATVSRDITELGLIKVDRSGSPAYALPAGGSVEQVAEARLASLLGARLTAIDGHGIDALRDPVIGGVEAAAHHDARDERVLRDAEGRVADQRHGHLPAPRDFVDFVLHRTGIRVDKNLGHGGGL